MTTREINIKSIPGHWDNIKKACYVIYLDDEGKQNVIVPFKSSLGTKLKDNYYVNIYSSKKELKFYTPGTMGSTYKMKLVVETKDGAKCWVIEDMAEGHAKALEKVSMSHNKLVDEVYYDKE